MPTSGINWLFLLLIFCVRVYWLVLFYNLVQLVVKKCVYANCNISIIFRSMLESKRKLFLTLCFSVKVYSLRFNIKIFKCCSFDQSCYQYCSCALLKVITALLIRWSHASTVSVHANITFCRLMLSSEFLRF